MSLSTQWTQVQLRSVVRRELLDPSGRFWPDAELNTYIERWQTLLQSQFEFVWGTATAAVGAGTSTHTLSAIAPDMMRLDAVYWEGTRLVGRSKDQLDEVKRDWRRDDPQTPRAVYQDDLYTLSLYPTPSTSGTMVLEYPKVATFGTDETTAMLVPAWTRYSCKNFCVHHALLRTGPNQDLGRAQRREKKFQKQLMAYRTMLDNFFPSKTLTLRPSGRYEASILDPRTSGLLS